MAKKIFIGVIIILVAGMAVQAQDAYDKKLKTIYKNTVPQIRPSAVKSKLDAHDKIILLDTRSPEEFRVSHIPGASFINYDQFKTSDVVPIDRDAEIIVYCTVGYRSERIGEKLIELGFTNVKNLYGGIFQWANDGELLLNKKNQPTDSVHTYSRSWASWLQRGIKVH